MTLGQIDIKAAITDAEKLLQNDKQIAPPVRAVMSVLLLAIKLLMARTGLNSRNSSIPPSQDQNRQRQKKASGKRKAGGQPGRNGTTLKPVNNPDEVQLLKLDRRTLPRGNWREVGYESRQVIDRHIQRHVTEYRVQILENELGERYVADFPAGVTRPIQYGESVKAHAIYLSMFQLLPYERIPSMFASSVKTVGRPVEKNRANHMILKKFLWDLRAMILVLTLVPGLLRSISGSRRSAGACAEQSLTPKSGNYPVSRGSGTESLPPGEGGVSPAA